MPRRERRRSKAYQEAIKETQEKIQELAKGLQPGEYIDFCNELEFFFQEESERMFELLEQRELGIIE